MNETVKALLEESRATVERLWPEQKYYVPEVKADEAFLSAKAPSNTVRAKGKIGGAVRFDPVGKSAMTAEDALSRANARVFTAMDSPLFTIQLRQFMMEELESRGHDFDTAFELLFKHLKSELLMTQATLAASSKQLETILSKAASIARGKKVNWQDKSRADKITWILQYSDSNDLKSEIKKYKEDRSHLMAAINAKEEDLIAMATSRGLPATTAAGFMYLIETDEAVKEYQEELFKRNGDAEAMSKAPLRFTVFSMAGRSMLTLLLQVEGHLEAQRRGEVTPRIDKVKKKKKNLFFRAVPDTNEENFKTAEQTYKEGLSLIGTFENGRYTPKSKLWITRESGTCLIEGTSFVLDPRHLSSLPQTLMRMEIQVLKFEQLDTSQSLKIEFADYEAPQEVAQAPAPQKPKAVVRMVGGMQVDVLLGLTLTIKKAEVGGKMESIGFIGDKIVCLVEGNLDVPTLTVNEHLQTHEHRHQLSVTF